MKIVKRNQLKPRVHLAPSLDYGGLETQLTNLGFEYYKTGRTDAVEFWSLRSGGIAETKLKELGFVVRTLNFEFRTINPVLVLKLTYLFRAVGAKEVFTHGFESNLNGIIAARLAGIKLVIAEEIGISKHKHLLHLAFKFSYSLIKNLSVQSQQMKISIEKSHEIDMNKVIVIYPPVRLDGVLQQYRQPSTEITPVISTKVGIAEEIIISNKNGYLSPDHSVDSYLICLLNAFALKSNEFMDISSAAISSAKGRFDPSIYLKELDKLVEAAN